jgi:hypothetical protein
MKIFIIRNKEGKYLRSKGFDGRSPIKPTNWVDKIEDAKIYTKIGTAKGRITFFFNNYPKFGCPLLLEFNLSEMQPKVIDLEEETTKKVAKIKKKQAAIEAAYKEYQIRHRQSEIARLENSLRKLKRNEYSASNSKRRNKLLTVVLE